VDLDLTDKSMQKKIREAQLSQYNFILVVGKEEEDTNAVNVRTRDNAVHGAKDISKVIEEFRQLSREFK